MKEIVKILNTNKYSVNIKSDYTDIEKINSYYPTFRSLKLLDKFLTILDKDKGGSALLSGAYGTGKSYFTAILLSMLSGNFKTEEFSNFIQKSEKIYNIKSSFDKFKDKKYFIVFVDDSTDEFSKGLLLGLRQAAKRENIKLNLTTQYEVIEEKIENWRENYPAAYTQFQNLLNEEEQETKFYSLLKSRDNKALEIFSKNYEQMFAGEKFSPLEKANKIEEVLKETEEAVLETGWDGIIYVFDEFGRYLESNINTIDVKEVQDMAEYCNKGNNSFLLLITHKDIFQYSGKLNQKEERDEWEKVSGRFLKEHLVYEKTNVLEILSNIMVKENYASYRAEHLEVFKRKENLLTELQISNDKAEESTEKFYPLDFVTASVLPDLSQKLAQNERTLFAFICSNEEKGLKNILESSLDIFVTLDKVYDYFEETLKIYSPETSEYKTYLHTKNVLSKLNESEIEEKKFIKILAAIYIYNKFSEIEPTPEVMKYIFNREDIGEIEEVLKRKNLISYRRHYNHYKIVEDIDVNVDMEVKEYIEEKLSSFDYTETLDRALKKESYYPLKYNDRNKINRYMGQYYLDASGINRIKHIESNIYEDGKIIYLTNIEGNENYQEIENILIKKGFIVISNKDGKTLEILDSLKELEAMERLGNSEERYLKEGILKRELESYKTEVIAKIRNSLKVYFDKEINLLEETDRYLEDKYSKYIPVNYELINKHNLSVPMKKARLDILKKIKDKTELEFEDTKAESSVARILVRNCKLYENNALSINESVFSKLVEEILKTIKSGKVSVADLYETYCSNKGVYGLRKGIFTFILGIIIVDNWEEISIISTGSKNEIDTDFSLLDTLEKNPEKYDIAYYSIAEEEMEYMKGLEEIFSAYIPKKEDKIYNRVLIGMKNYMLSLPRYMTGIYIKNYKNLDRIFRGIFSVNSGKQFLLSDLPKAYRTENYKEIISRLDEDLMKFENSRREFLELLIKETTSAFEKSSKDLRELIEELEEKEKLNEVEELLVSLKSETEERIIAALSQKIKGFSYENWRNQDDILDYKRLLSEELKIVHELKENEEGETAKLTLADQEKVIDLTIEETVMGKMLQSKIESTIKNIGISVSEKEKIKILAKILLKM